MLTEQTKLDVDSTVGASDDGQDLGQAWIPDAHGGCV